ncbi:MAG TPA: hypothetical protein VHC98_01210 [Candidatus Saccharimonadales bacterium]|nr:hypothetical protein [Candidatus Saccharimonadales bacterium]
MATAASNSKDTIYVDVDDEITTIIDKVRSSSARVLALVLPKRASVFQSIVNMKLLKRSADEAKKHVVLITTEAGLMPLAGSVGLYVAATPSSKPEVPPTAGAGNANQVVDAEEDDGYTADNAGDRAVGDLSGEAEPVGTSAIETVDLPDEPEMPDAADEDEAPAKKPAKAKDRHLKVPNFNKFRLRLFLGAIVLVLIVFGLYICLAILPKAAIAITTNTSALNVNLTMTLNPSAQAVDTSQNVIPATAQQQQKTTSQQVATTGQQNNGQTATGSVTMTAQKCSGSGNPASVPAGTGVSTNGLTFITQETTVFHITSFNNGCGIFSSDATSITAQNAGSKYNVSNATFTVAGRSDVTATGSTSGGTDDIIHIVAQADIDNAKQKLASQDTNAVKTSLEQALRGQGLYPLETTFNAGTPVITSDNNAGDQADTVTVTQAVTYTMYGVKQADLDTLIKHATDGQIDPSKQSILNDGLNSATMSVGNTSGNTVQLTLQTTATIGPDINAADIKKQAAGKKIGDVKSFINAIPGVTKVDVHLSPFWVGAVPGKTSKITVTITGAAQTHGSN